MNIRIAAIALTILLLASAAASQTTEFTYQGSLTVSGSPANGNYDFEFAVFDSLSTGTQFGPTLTKSAVAVSTGSFAVKLDFGSQFPGANRFLEIRVRPAGGGGYTPLAPRQQVNSAPYSVKAANADNATTAATATNATQLGGLAAGQYVLTGDTRLSDARNPMPGSANYIQNQNTEPQASSNFNISGNGTVDGTLTGNVVNTATQFNIGGARILSNAGYQNLFAGIGAGQSNTGPSNSFFGNGAGFSNVGGAGNSFFGRGAGIVNNTGAYNSFFGANAGAANTSGTGNVFVGLNSGASNTTENSNTYIGPFTNGAAGITNGTAIGSRGAVTSSNSLVLGSINGINGAIASTNVGIGTTAPQYKLHVVGENVRVENSATFPRFSLNNTSAGADQKRWQNYASTSALNFTSLNDAENAETFWLQVIRGTGTAISSVSFPNGNVGIGTTAPSEKFTVDGTIRSLSGGFKFVDGSVQTIAAGTTYTTLREGGLEIAPAGSPTTSVVELNLPPGTYILTATLDLSNEANWVGQNNVRRVRCSFTADPANTFTWELNGFIDGYISVSRYITATVHSVNTVTTGPIGLSCGELRGGTDRSYAYTYRRRLTATRIENIIVQ